MVNDDVGSTAEVTRQFVSQCDGSHEGCTMAITLSCPYYWTPYRRFMAVAVRLVLSLDIKVISSIFRLLLVIHEVSVKLRGSHDT